jgi:hypothetical protein
VRSEQDAVLQGAHDAGEAAVEVETVGLDLGVRGLEGRAPTVVPRPCGGAPHTALLCPGQGIGASVKVFPQAQLAPGVQSVVRVTGLSTACDHGPSTQNAI